MTAPPFDGEKRPQPHSRHLGRPACRVVWRKLESCRGGCAAPAGRYHQWKSRSKKPGRSGSLGAAEGGGGAGGRPFLVTDRSKELPEKLYCEGGADFPTGPGACSSGPATTF